MAYEINFIKVIIVFNKLYDQFKYVFRNSNRLIDSDAQSTIISFFWSKIQNRDRIPILPIHFRTFKIIESKILPLVLATGRPSLLGSLKSIKSRVNY